MFLIFSPFYFQDFGSSLLSLLWIVFQVDCLFLLHLFVLVGFYLAPSTAVYFSVFLFCLTYCVWGLLSQAASCSSWNFLCLPPVGKVCSIGCVGFLLEGTGACFLVDESGSCLSSGQDHIGWCVLECVWPYFDFRKPLCWWVGLCSSLASCLA